MDWRTSLRRKTGLALIVVGCVSLSIPALASANVVNDVLSSIGLGGPSPQHGSNSGAATTATPATPRAGVPPTYVPPLHGTNPHGQGSAATIALAPSGPNPVSGTPGQPETVVLGSSKGEQNPDGSYHGHINILSLFGSEILSVNSTPGQSNSSPVAALQTSVLNPLCTGSGGNLCVTLLQADSATTATGSTNTFKTAAFNIGTGTSSIRGSAATSTGDISNNSTCQTASGTSNVANANVLSAITADVADTSSTSKACNNGTPPSTTQSSRVININGAGVPIPAMGCENGVPNTNFTPLSPLATTVCNASDPGTTGQATPPYGVREALTVFALIASTPLVKATTAGAESRAAAPPAVPTTPTTTTPRGGKGNGNGNGKGNGEGEEGGGAGVGNAASNAQGGNGSLAFTGANLLWIAMLGLGLVGAGLAVAAVNPGARRPSLKA